ncbi:MAG: hypothetical protein UR64_C0009G0020 [Candidatus Nomurabacteria bacterium GW2011_GWE1_35_16]|uniref:Uncharacterized protein n=1 Tax=Candidatus Nomurabacteria bacterium GW2011_GWE1_35_16 TaxID=1618761 RepID=A0A0G0EG47_9BACT|nr:MAG: hypothetical protein UR64_C0009G0020 [Candidatus Nomurabacteria bacterium GW2011_GWE1_35_16]
MKIIFKAKKIIAVSEFTYCPKKREEKGTRATKKRKIPFKFENLVSIFLARTEAMR